MEDGKTLFDIPRHIIESEGWKKSKEMANKVKWINNRQIMYMALNGVERIFTIETNKDGSIKYTKGLIDLNMDGFISVPYFDPEETADYHFYNERLPLQYSQSKERLQRMYHKYKRGTLIYNIDDSDKQTTADRNKVCREHPDFVREIAIRKLIKSHDRIINVQDHILEVDFGTAEDSYKG